VQELIKILAKLSWLDQTNTHYISQLC